MKHLKRAVYALVLLGLASSWSCSTNDPADNPLDTDDSDAETSGGGSGQGDGDVSPEGGSTPSDQHSSGDETTSTETGDGDDSTSGDGDGDDPETTSDTDPGDGDGDGDDTSGEPADDCVEEPTTHLEIINACTDAVRVTKTPALLGLNADGSLPPLP